MQTQGSVWRTVPGFCRYEASETGEIRRIANGEILPTGSSDSGYLIVKVFSDAGTWVRRRVHTLVLLAWIGPAPTPKHECAHGLGGKLDNSVRNLRWKTHEENEADKRESGTMSRGGAIPPKPREVVTSILAAVEAGQSFSSVAKAFGVHRSSVSRYARGLRRVG